MKFGRYKDHDWESGYQHARRRLGTWIAGEGCNALVAYESQHMLKNHYRGPWRMILKMALRELQSAWNHYGWPKWNWIRVNVFRRPQDEALAAVQREQEEYLELEKLGLL